jgi:hypothetical protein
VGGATPPCSNPDVEMAHAGDLDEWDMEDDTAKRLSAVEQKLYEAIAFSCDGHDTPEQNQEADEARHAEVMTAFRNINGKIEARSCPSSLLPGAPKCHLRVVGSR